MSAIVFSHIGLNCNDPIASERYYTRHFGFRRARVVDIDGAAGGRQIVFLVLGSVYLELFQAEGPGGATEPPRDDGPTRRGVRHLAFKVDDVDAMLAAMGDEGRRAVTLGPLSFDDVVPGWKTVWLTDPDGNVIEISQGYEDEDDPPKLTPRGAERG